jgi:PTS system cellobiose-specific IIB component
MVNERRNLMRKITLVCNAGMSTAMLAKKMNEAAKGEYYVEAHGEGEFLDYIKGSDLILVGPQIRHLMPNIKAAVGDIPVHSINPRYYGLMDAKGVLSEVSKILGDNI